MKGKIKRVLRDKNYGFIEAEDQEKDIFFHRSAIGEGFFELKEGDEVEFELEETDRGIQAANLKIL